MASFGLLPAPRPSKDADRMLFVTESLPEMRDGGGMRSREVLTLATQVFCVQPWLAARSIWPESAEQARRDPLFRRLGATIIPEMSAKAAAISGARHGDVDVLAPTFRSANGGGNEMHNFSAFASSGRNSGRRPLTLVLLAMWSFKLAPSHDPHLTIPEVYTPLARLHAPEACVVIISDDLQHRRFKLESNLSAASARRLREREVAAYAAADGVFFVSREDRQEAEAMLRERREAEAIIDPHLTIPEPLLLTLPYSGGRSGTRSTPPTARRPGRPLLLFVGSATRSNEVATSWLVSSVLPKLRAASPELQLTLVGSSRRKHADVEGVVVLGFVEDLSKLISEASILLLPSFVDSGVATKVLLGIHHSLPVVTTSAGSRGIWHASDTLPPPCSSGTPPLVVRDGAAEFAKAVLHLLDDDDAYFGIRRCVSAFGHAKKAVSQQRVAMERMRDHCRVRAASRHSLPFAAAAAQPPADAATTPQPRLVPSLSSSADEKLPFNESLPFDRLLKHANWRSESTPPRALDLTIITSFASGDAGGDMRGWLADVARQSALRIFAIELAVCTFDAGSYATMLDALSSSLGLLGGLARVSLSLLASDPGEFGLLDEIVSRPGCAPILTVWNIGERKSPQSLRRRLNVLNADARTDAVTSGALLFRSLADLDRYTASPPGSRRSRAAGRLFNLRADRRIGLKDLLLLEWRREPRPEPVIAGYSDLPRRSVMWRRALHVRLGGFRADTQRSRGLSCFDISFWLRAVATAGAHVRHINEPLEWYVDRTAEASRGANRTDAGLVSGGAEGAALASAADSAAHAADPTTDWLQQPHAWKHWVGPSRSAPDGVEWRNECDDPSAWRAYRRALIEPAWRDHVKWQRQQREVEERDAMLESTLCLISGFAAGVLCGALGFARGGWPLRRVAGGRVDLHK